MIVVDIEASGVDYNKHSIVSIGALDFFNPQNRFYAECKIWHGAHLDKEALKINGFTEEEITDPTKKSETEIVREFIAWVTNIKDHTMAGQNVCFDRDFLQAAAHRGHLNWSFAHRIVDAHTLAYMHMIKRGITPPLKNNHTALSLDSELKYVGVPEEPKPHNALTGAMSHAEVISRLLYNKPLLDEFKDYPMPNFNE
ncbi:MAG: 3'-5' exonuclease [Patescibacteria group bacterium]